MNAIDSAEKLRPLGEANFSFPTAGVRVKLSVTNDALTPCSSLVPWAACTEHFWLIDKLNADGQVVRTILNAALVYDVIHSFTLNTLTDGRRFSHIERLRYDPTILELYWRRVVKSVYAVLD